MQAVMNALRLLTRTLLRSSTLSFASKKEGENYGFLKQATWNAKLLPVGEISYRVFGQITHTLKVSERAFLQAKF